VLVTDDIDEKWNTYTNDGYSLDSVDKALGLVLSVLLSHFVEVK
jgi:hypothetical protein